MLVNATEMLKKAKAGHYAVGQFNINNLEWTKAILLTAQELNSPVILGVSEDYRRVELLSCLKDSFCPLKVVDVELTNCIMACFCFFQHFCCVY